MRKKKLLFVPLAILGMALFIFIGGEIVRLLWNWLLPPLFGWRLITFWQAVGLLALCRILFGRFGMNGHGHSNFRRRVAERRGWGPITPEERERFRQAIRDVFTDGPSTSESPGQ